MPLPEDNMFYDFKLTDEQKTYVDAVFDYQMVIVDAPSGSGKTTMAVAAAHVLEKPLIYTFSTVEEGSMGHTPGTVEEKESKYTSPLLDALKEIGEDLRFAIESENNPDMINDKAWVKAVSHTFLRGSNIKNSTLILDETQNMTRGEIKKVLTRCHDSTTVIMIGHAGQNDLKKPEKSGFVPYLNHFKDEPYVKVCELTENFRGRLAQKADEMAWK